MPPGKSGTTMFVNFAQPRSGDTHRVPKRFWSEMRLFQRQPELIDAGKYTITSDVDPKVVDLFFARVMGDDSAVVTTENAQQLRALCDELGFAGFDDELRVVLDGNVRLEDLQRQVLEVKDRMKAIEMRLDEVLRAVGGKSSTAELESRVLELERQLREVRDKAGSGEVCVNEIVRNSVDGAPAPTVKITTESSARKAPALVEGDFVYDEARPLDGIIARLTRECGGNVHAMGVVEVTASSCDRGNASNVVELESSHGFRSKNGPDQWIRYDFKGRRVAPTSYSIWMAESYFPRPWVLEVSNDGSEGSWEVVDRRDDNRDLKACGEPCNFKINAPPHESFRFVRLRQAVKNFAGNNVIEVISLEIFGTLTDMPHPAARPGEFPFYDLHPLDGIIAHLTRECGGNVHDKGAVEVTASSESDLGYDARHAVELEKRSCFVSNNEPNSWIRYDFKERRVCPTSYSIRVGCFVTPRSWVLEVSNDGSEGSWDIVDCRDTQEWTKQWETHNFAISARLRESFRFVRLRVTGRNACGTDAFGLASLEIFGTLSSE